MSVYGCIICQRKMPKLVLNDTDNNDTSNYETEKSSRESINDIQNGSKKSIRSNVRKSRDLLFEKTMYDFVLDNISFIAIEKEIVVKTKIAVSLHIFT